MLAKLNEIQNGQDSFYSNLRKEKANDISNTVSNYGMNNQNEETRINNETKKIIEMIKSAHSDWDFTRVMNEGKEYHDLIKQGMSAEEAYNSLNKDNRGFKIKEEAKKLFEIVRRENPYLSGEQIRDLLSKEPKDMLIEGKTAEEVYEYLKVNNKITSNEFIISHYN